MGLRHDYNYKRYLARTMDEAEELCQSTLEDWMNLMPDYQSAAILELERRGIKVDIPEVNLIFYEILGESDR